MIPNKKDMPEILQDLMGIMDEQFLTLRYEDPYDKTIKEMINLSMIFLTQSVMSMTLPHKREEFFEENFPYLVDSMERHFKKAIEVLKKNGV